MRLEKYNNFIKEQIDVIYNDLCLYDCAHEFKINDESDLYLGGMKRNVDTDTFLYYIYNKIKNKRIILRDKIDHRWENIAEIKYQPGIIDISYNYKDIKNDERLYNIVFRKLSPSEPIEISLWEGVVRIFDEPLVIKEKNIRYSKEDPYGEEDWLDD
jgi:hypothetical protein